MANVSYLSSDGPQDSGCVRSSEPVEPRGGGRPAGFGDASGNRQTSSGGAVLPGPCSRAGITCQNAADVARAGDGRNPETDDERSQVIEIESTRLIRWAGAHSLWVDSRILQMLLVQPAHGGNPIGGAEHFVHAFCDDQTEVGVRIWKITRNGRFGFVPSCDGAGSMPREWFRLRWATPSEYLQRLDLLNFLAPETETRLEGFAQVDGNFHVITSQRYIKIEGGSATAEEVEKYFNDLGFVALLATGGPDSLTSAWYHEGDNLAVFDAWADNFILYEGRLFPVDVIPVEPGPDMAELIKHALELPLDSR